MKKKKYFTYSYLLIASAFLFSCEDVTTEDNTTSATFTSFEEVVQGRLPALYANLRSDALYRQGGVINTWSDAGVDTHSGTLFPAEYVPLYAYTYGEGTLLIAETWAEFYRSIKQINSFLGQVKNFSANEDSRNEAIGEARFLRALLYFDMVKIWGDIPLILNENLSLEDFRNDAKIANSTAEEIYLQIEKDLIFAKENLLSKTQIPTTDIASKEAAQTLLGKVYLQMTTTEEFGGVEGGIDANGNEVSRRERFEQAGKELEAIIDSGIFSLEENFADVFDDKNERDNTEVIFAVAYNGPNLDTGGDFGDFLGLGNNKDGGGFGAFRANLDFALEYLKNDGIVSKTEDVSPNNELPKKLKFFNGDINFSGPVRLLGPENFISDERFEQTIARFNAITLADNSRGVIDATPRNLFNAQHLDLNAWGPYKYVKPIPNPNNAGDGSVDFPFLRYADVLLMYAEIQNELGNTDVAIQYTNLVIDRALKDQVLKDIPEFVDPDANPRVSILYNTPTDEDEGTDPLILAEAVRNNLEDVTPDDFLITDNSISKDEMLNLIIRERALELAYEGKRKDDLLRTGKLDEIINNLHINSINSSLANQEAVKASFVLSKHVHWPIPLREIILNENLKQNCEYGDASAGCF